MLLQKDMENKRNIAGLDVLEIPGDENGATILLLHGFGANALDLASLHGVYRRRPRPTWIFPDAPLEIPIAPGYTGRAWFEIDFEGLQKAFQEHNFEAVSKAFPPELTEARTQIESLIGELEVPRSKLIIGGFSQGAVLATETALHGNERMAGLLIFSGTVVCEPDWRKLSHLHAKTPFFQSHGLQDPLLPIKKAEELENLLLEGGLEGKLHSFKGGHEIPQLILLQLNAFLTNLLS